MVLGQKQYELRAGDAAQPLPPPVPLEEWKQGKVYPVPCVLSLLISAWML